MPSLGYGFKFSDIVIPENTPTILLKMTHNDDTVEYPLDYDEGGWAHYSRSGDIYFYSPNSDTNYTLQIQNFTEDDVGDEYTINLSLPEEPTQSFTSATHEAQKSGYVIEPDVYYDGDVTFPDGGESVTVTLQGNPDVEHFSEWSVSINGHQATYVSNENVFIYSDADIGDTIIFGTHNGVYVLATAEGSFSGTITFKVQFGSTSVEQFFADAVHMVLGEEVLWEGDVTDTPQPIPFPSPVTTWTAFSLTIDGKKATTYADYVAETHQWIYSYMVGEEPAILIEINEEQGTYTIVSLAPEVTNHVKISKIADNTIRIPSYIDESDKIIIEGGSANDLLAASEAGYMLYLWCEDYSLTTPITISYIDNAIRFDALVYNGTNQMAWTINQNGEIIGSFGGIT